jgi:PucR family transcriptional regulator, purine catabolism regulatory protein
MPADLLSLKDLLRLSFPESVSWLQGAEFKDRPVQWVAASLQEARPGDILLLNAEDMSEVLVDQARKQGLNGLVLFGKAAHLKLDLPQDLPVIQAPESAGEIREVQRLMLTLLINQRAALIERGVRLHAQLSQLEAEGKGLGGLAKAMSEISGRGVLIQDKRGRLLAQHPSSILLSIWEDALEQLGGLDSLPESLVDRRKAGSQTGILAQKIPGGLERLVSPISVGEVARGYLSLVGLNGELDDLDYLVAEQGGLVCAVEMARNKAVREAEKRLKGDLLTALIQDNLSPREARLWVQAMGFDLSQSHVALRFAWDGPASPSRRRLETLVNGEVSRLGLQVIVSPMEAEIICFCQVPAGEKRPELALAFGQAVLDQEAREYPEVPGRCGVGTVAPALEDWRTSLRQAGQALELARRLSVRRPLYYGDLSVYRLLFQLEHSPEASAFLNETLGPLLDYEGSAELLHTLETFFEHNANLSQTAEALFIHRNTLIYRMERIAAITNLDLEDPENRLAIQLALRIYRMAGSKPG